MYVIQIKGTYIMQISVVELRTHFKNVVNRIKLDREPATITKNGKPEAVIMEINDYNSMVETLYLLGNSINNQKIDEALNQFHARKMKPRKLINA